MSLTEPANVDESAIVAGFLQDNPDWLARWLAEHPERLHLLPVPQTGGTVSLAERQLSDLRRRNAELSDRLRELTQNARRNEKLFAASRQLSIRLFEVRDLDTALHTLQTTVRTAFGFEAVAVLSTVLGSSPAVRDPAPVEHLLGRTGVFLGNVRSDEARALFGTDAGATSVAIAPLRGQRPLGHLAFGSSNAAHFAAGQGTVFVEFVAELAGCALEMHLDRPRAAT